MPYHPLEQSERTNRALIGPNRNQNLQQYPFPPFPHRHALLYTLHVYHSFIAIDCSPTILPSSLIRSQITLVTYVPLRRFSEPESSGSVLEGVSVEFVFLALRYLLSKRSVYLSLSTFVFARRCRSVRTVGGQKGRRAGRGSCPLTVLYLNRIIRDNVPGLHMFLLV